MTDWELISKKELYQGEYGSAIEKWKMRTHLGEEREYTVRKGDDFIILLALTDENEVVVAHEYFPASQKRMVSLVGGIIDDGFNHLETAKKEFIAEAGYEAKEFIHLGPLVRGKYNTGVMHAYLATGAKKVGRQDLEPSEDIQIELVPVDRFKKMLKDGKIGCVLEVATAYMALDHLNLL